MCGFGRRAWELAGDGFRARVKEHSAAANAGSERYGGHSTRLSCINEAHGMLAKCTQEATGGVGGFRGTRR